MPKPTSKSSTPQRASLRVLVVEHNQADVELCVKELERAGFEVSADMAETPEQFSERLAQQEYDLVLADYRLPSWTGMDALKILREHGKSMPFILVTGTLGEERAVEAIKQGATDYVLKGHLATLPVAVRRALKERELLEGQERAEEALRESEERYRLVAETATDALITIDQDSRILFVNPAAERIFGYARREMLGQQLTMLMPEALRHIHRAGISRYLETGQKHLSWDAMELPGLHKSGKEIPLEVSFGELVRDGRHLFTGIVRDVSQRKEAQQALQRSEASLRSLVDNAPHAIYKTNLDAGRFISVNPALVAMLGCESEAEVLALDLPTQVYRNPEARARLLPELERLGYFKDLELEWKRKDGKLLLLRTSGRLVQDETGATSCEAIGEDITERRLLEQQFRQAQKMEAIGQLAGGVAHDFNNLLMVISSFTELVSEAGATNDTQRHHLDEVLKASRRAATLTRQLLAFSRKQVLTPSVLDLNSVIADLGKMLPRLIGAHIKVQLQAKAPSARVEADPGQLEQILMNLAVNARDAMPKGGTLMLEVSQTEFDTAHIGPSYKIPPGSYIMLAVSDTGEGMDAETQSHIFEPFFTTKERGKGTGLGLATVYGIVKQSGGYISVYSEKGVGTTFKMYFPKAEKELSADPGKAGQAKAAGGKEAILLVEDEEPVRLAAREFLRMKGYTLLEAADGAEALRVHSQHTGRIHLLVTDVVMPGGSGRELAEELQTLDPRLRVLYISGYTGGSVGSMAGLDPGASFLQKPFALEALARKVREVLDAAGTVPAPAGS